MDKPRTWTIPFCGALLTTFLRDSRLKAKEPDKIEPASRHVGTERRILANLMKMNA
jgi:hypothetical protein